MVVRYVISSQDNYSFEDMRSSKTSRLEEIDSQTLVVQKRIEKIEKDSEKVGDMTDKIAADVGAIVAVLTGAVSSVLLARDLFHHYDPRSPELNEKIYQLTKRFHAEGERLLHLRTINAPKSTLQEAMKKVEELRGEIERLNKADVPLRKDFIDKIRGGRINWKTTGQMGILIGSIVLLLTVVLRWVNRHLTLVHKQILKRRKQTIIGESGNHGNS